MSASRSRQKRKLEPISLEELAGATGMSGFCSFLTRDTQVPVPVLDQFEKSAPELPAPESSGPEKGAVGPAAPETEAVESTDKIEKSAPGARAPESSEAAKGAVDLAAPGAGAVESTAIAEAAPGKSAPEATALDSGYGKEESAPESSPAAIGALETGASDFRFRRRPRIREARTLQDGHSLAEQAVYEAMHGAGKPYRDDSRILTIGLRTLAELSRMAYSNCKANVRSLVAKKAIDELPGFSYTDGRTYIIYGPAEILRRRKEAGLTHVLRTRGVAFVDPKSGAPQGSAPDSTAPDMTAPPNLESSAPESILAALRRQDPAADEAAAAVLWQRCREVEPSATPEEVVQFIHLKGGQPIGFLLSAVPRCFQGASFRQFREWARSSLNSR